MARIVVTHPFEEDLIEARTVVRFGGLTEDGREVIFAADHRPAAALAIALRDSDDDIEIDIENWQIIHQQEAP